MKLNEIDKMYLDVEISYKDLNDLVAQFIIDELKEKNLYQKMDVKNPLNDLMLNYFYLKRNCQSKYLDTILDNYSINYSSSVHNAIYDLCLNVSNASLWPGVFDIKTVDNHFLLKTRVGTIKVYRANKIITSHILNKELKGNCFMRSLEFMNENNDYKAVLSYDNNMFVGGHFHAYLKNKDTILDIASNALYFDFLSSTNVLNGLVLKELTHDEVVDEFNKVKDEIPTISSNDDKLQVLALYYAKKKGIK